jgi:hypothetical protein
MKCSAADGRGVIGVSVPDFPPSPVVNVATEMVRYRLDEVQRLTLPLRILEAP